MGGPVILDFLNSKSTIWKDNYIAAYIPLSPPFGGAVSSVLAGISGDKFGIPIVSDDIFLPIQRYSPSGPW